MNKNKNVDLKKMNTFLRKNKSVDFRKADLHHKASLEALKWDVSRKSKESLLKQLKAYQRLLRLLPNGNGDLVTDDIAKALLQKGITSSLQIALMPRNTFIKDTLKIFLDDVSLAERVYKRAIACRKRVVLKYMNRLQGLEPHARAAGLNR